jgi:hypothetical protein
MCPFDSVNPREGGTNVDIHEENASMVLDSVPCGLPKTPKAPAQVPSRRRIPAPRRLLNHQNQSEGSTEDDIREELEVVGNMTFESEDEADDGEVSPAGR